LEDARKAAMEAYEKDQAAKAAAAATSGPTSLPAHERAAQALAKTKKEEVLEGTDDPHDAWSAEAFGYKAKETTPDSAAEGKKVLAGTVDAVQQATQAERDAYRKEQEKGWEGNQGEVKEILDRVKNTRGPEAAAALEAELSVKGPHKTSAEVYAKMAPHAKRMLEAEAVYMKALKEHEAKKRSSWQVVKGFFKKEQLPADLERLRSRWVEERASYGAYMKSSAETRHRERSVDKLRRMRHSPEEVLARYQRRYVTREVLLGAEEAELKAKTEGFNEREKSRLEKAYAWYMALPPRTRIYGTAAAMTTLGLVGGAVAAGGFVAATGYGLASLVLGAASAKTRYEAEISKDPERKKKLGWAARFLGIGSIAGLATEGAVRLGHSIAGTEAKAESLVKMGKAEREKVGNLGDMATLDALSKKRGRALTKKEDLQKQYAMAAAAGGLVGGLTAGHYLGGHSAGGAGGHEGINHGAITPTDHNPATGDSPGGHLGGSHAGANPDAKPINNISLNPLATTPAFPVPNLAGEVPHMNFDGADGAGAGGTTIIDSHNTYNYNNINNGGDSTNIDGGGSGGGAGGENGGTIAGADGKPEAGDLHPGDVVIDGKLDMTPPTIHYEGEGVPVYHGASVTITEDPSLHPNLPHEAGPHNAINALEKLQDQLKTQYGSDMDHAPALVKHMLDTKAEDLAKEIGFYKPNDASGLESGIVHAGDKFEFTENGAFRYESVDGKELVFGQELAPADINPIVAAESGTAYHPTGTQFEGRFQDTDHSGALHHAGAEAAPTAHAATQTADQTIVPKGRSLSEEQITANLNRAQMSGSVSAPQFTEVPSGTAPTPVEGPSPLTDAPSVSVAPSAEVGVTDANAPLVGLNGRPSVDAPVVGINGQPLSAEEPPLVGVKTAVASFGQPTGAEAAPGLFTLGDHSPIDATTPHIYSQGGELHSYGGGQKAFDAAQEMARKGNASVFFDQSRKGLLGRNIYDVMEFHPDGKGGVELIPHTDGSHLTDASKFDTKIN
jgi:hypothetical protein